MVNITHKPTTLRKAVAGATVQVSRQETIDAIRNRTVPKGDVFAFAQAAGLLAVKKTSDVIPDCHPLPVEYTAVRYAIEGLTVSIEVEVHTVYRTGVEVEAMHGAAVAALTMYDMLKPIDKAVEIGSIKLLQKKGGKSDAVANAGAGLKAAVVVCSDTISAGCAVDTAGKLAVERLRQFGFDNISLDIIPDEADVIREKATTLTAAGTDLILFAGGTGVSPRDVTPDVIGPLLETPIPGIMEAVRHYGQQRMPYGMLSRGVAGFIKQALVITLPGSRSAVEEAMDCLFPHVLHVFLVRTGMRHS